MGTTPRIVLWPLLALLVLAPLPLGGNRPIPWTILALTVGVLLLIWVAGAHRRPARALVPLDRLLPALLGFALVMVVVVVQVVPFTPRAWHHPLWLEAAGALGSDVVGRISVDPYQTGTAAMLLLADAGVFWLALQLSRSATVAGQIVRILVLAGLGYALYGLVAHLLDLGTILWWKRWYPFLGLSSTFVNRNSYATYAGLGLLCAVGLLITTTYRDLARAARRRVPWRRRLLRLTWRQWWVMAAVMALAFALVLTRSRAGVASSAVGLAVLIGCFGATRLMRPRDVLISGALALGLAILVFALGGDELAERFEEHGLESPRFATYQRIGQAIADAPWLGTGYGTFPEVYRGYQRQVTTDYWNHAHSTYLENALELGVPGAAALVGAIGWVALHCARGLQRRRRNALYPCLGVAATTLVGLHALLDFSLELPAVAVTYAAIMGIAFGRARHRRGRRVDPEHGVWRSRPHQLALGLAVVAGNGLLLLAVPRLVADLNALPLTLVQSQLEAQVTPPGGTLDRAIAAGRTAAAWANAGETWWHVGLAELILARHPEMLANARRTRLDQAARALRRSLAWAPANPAGWMHLAYAALLRNDDPSLIRDALALSVRTGPNEGRLMPFRSGLAALAWDRLDERTRTMFAAQFALTMRFSPRPFVDVVRRQREGVEVVRAQIDDDPRASATFERLLLLLGRN